MLYVQQATVAAAKLAEVEALAAEEIARGSPSLLFHFNRSLSRNDVQTLSLCDWNDVGSADAAAHLVAQNQAHFLQTSRLVSCFFFF